MISALYQKRMEKARIESNSLCVYIHLKISPMPKPPLSITIIAWLFIVAGVVGIVYHAAEIHLNALFGNDLLFALVVRLLAVVGGIVMLRGANWGRWLLIAWLAYHVVLSYFHSWPQTAMHAVLLVVIAIILFRPEANRYFINKNKMEIHQ